jgi:hypothetical protein
MNQVKFNVEFPTLTDSNETRYGVALEMAAFSYSFLWSLEELKMLRSEKLTQRQEYGSWEVRPNRILESCSKEQLQSKSIVRTLVNQWGWPLVLRCLSQFMDQKMIKSLINRAKGIFV